MFTYIKEIVLPRGETGWNKRPGLKLFTRTSIPGDSILKNPYKLKLEISFAGTTQRIEDLFMFKIYLAIIGSIKASASNIEELFKAWEMSPLKVVFLSPPGSNQVEFAINRNRILRKAFTFGAESVATGQTKFRVVVTTQARDFEKLPPLLSFGEIDVEGLVR